MAEYTIDKIEYNSNVYKLQDSVSGYITGISSSDVTTALGYTPLSSSSTLDATRLSGTIPVECYTDTDTKMTQTYAAESGYSYWRPLIIGYSSGSTEGFTPSTVTNTAYAFKSLTVQPSTGTIRVGNVSLYKGSYTVKFSPDTLTANRTITVPNATGTLALTSDIPTVPTITLNGSTTTTPSFYAPTTAGTDGYYLKSNGSGAPTWATIPAGVTVTLNGSTTTTPSFYAPTSVGTDGYVLKSNGSGAPTWTSATLTDEKLSVAEVTSGSIYYPIVGSGTSAATRQIDSTGFSYSGTNGTANNYNNGQAILTLGNSTKYDTAGWKQGILRLYTQNTGYVQIQPNSSSTSQNYNAIVWLPYGGGTLATTDQIITPSVLWIYGHDDGNGNITYDGPTYDGAMSEILSSGYNIRCYYSTTTPDPEDEYNIIFSSDYSVYYLSFYDDSYEDPIVFINTTNNNGNLTYSVITIDNNDNITMSTASGGGGSSTEIIRWTES